MNFHMENLTVQKLHKIRNFTILQKSELIQDGIMFFNQSLKLPFLNGVVSTCVNSPICENQHLATH
jgi:hypothetical protein